MENLGTNLTYLGASNNRLTDTGVIHLFKEFKILPQIIDLSSNKLGIDGV